MTIGLNYLPTAEKLYINVVKMKIYKTQNRIQNILGQYVFWDIYDKYISTIYIFHYESYLSIFLSSSESKTEVIITDHILSVLCRLSTNFNRRCIL